MNDVRVTHSIRARTWNNVISPTRQNSFSNWIVSRWALPERVRRTSPQTDFRKAASSVTRSALSAHIHQPSWHTTLAFDLRTWTRLTQKFDLRRRLSNLISVAHGALAFLQRTSSPQSMPRDRSFSLTVLQNRIRAIQQRAFLFHRQLPLQIEVPRSPTERLPNDSRTLSPETIVARSFFQSSAPAWIKTAHGWQHSKWAMNSVLSMFRSKIVLHTIANQIVATHNQSARPIYALTMHAKRLHLALRKSSQELLTQSSMVILPGVKPATRDNLRHPDLILRLRETIDGARSRPSMQFTLPTTTDQQELLTAIRNVEKSLSANHRALPAASNAVPDMQRLTSQVCDQFERQLRIERERRGR